MKKLMAIMLAGVMVVLFVACGASEFDWNTIVLKDQLPQPEVTRGEVVSNTAESLWLDLPNISEEQYTAYLQACKDKGYTIEPDEITHMYTAYNEQGYKLSLSYISDGELTIDLDAPMELGEFTWPTNGIAASFPQPDSKIGKIEWENEDSFLIYVGDTPMEDYEAYVNRCADAGYNIDYEKGDTYYWADNADGYRLSLEYRGFNIIFIRVDAPKETSDSDTDSDSENTTQAQANTDAVGDASFEEIYRAYKENELRADEQYKNNRYRVTAKVNSMTSDGLFNLTGGATLTMEARVDSTIVVFYAEFESDQEDALKAINVGDTITFVGECLSAGTWVECEIVTD